MPSNFQISRLHQLVVNRKINYVFSHAKNINKLEKWASIQRYDGVVENIESFRAGIAGTSPADSVLFFRNLDNFKTVKKG